MGRIPPPASRGASGVSRALCRGPGGHDRRRNAAAAVPVVAGCEVDSEFGAAGDASRAPGACAGVARHTDTGRGRPRAHRLQRADTGAVHARAATCRRSGGALTLPADTATAEAGLARRVGAALYELLLLTALAFITQFALLPLVSPGHASAARALTIPSVAAKTFLFCAQFAVGALYCVGFWTGGRRTLAQKTWALRLLTSAGGTPDLKRALLRYFALWVGPALALAAYLPLSKVGHGAYAAILLAFNFAWAAIDPQRRFLHDRIAGTQVVVSR